MNRQQTLALLFGLALIGGTGWFLSRLQGLQRLGEPGVIVGSTPLHGTNGVIVATNSVELPAAVLDYTSEPLPVTQLELGWLPPDTTYGRRRYRGPNGFFGTNQFWLDLNVVLMRSDRTSIHQPEYCLRGQGFEIQKSEQGTVPILRPHPYALPVTKLTAADQRRYRLADGREVGLRGLYVYWFVADDQLTANHWTRMWWMGRDLMRSGVLQRWAYVSCFAVCLPGQEDATYARMQEFIAASVPEFQRAAGPSDGLARNP